MNEWKVENKDRKSESSATTVNIGSLNDTIAMNILLVPDVHKKIHTTINNKMFFASSRTKLSLKHPN